LVRSAKSPTSTTKRKEEIVQREDGSYLVDGLLPVVDFQERLPITGVEELARERGFETAAGLLLVLLGRIPTVGDSVEWQGYRFEVVDMDGQRIDKILVVPPRSPLQEQTSAALASGHRGGERPG
jgi:putative hemolysin